jgi:hypothetical protein
MDKKGNNNEEISKNTMQVIEILEKGGQIDKNPFLAARIRKAIRGDPSSLNKYLQEHPRIMEDAGMKIMLDRKLKEENPFWPPPHEKDEGVRLSGPLQFGLCIPSKNIFGIDPKRLNLNVMVVGRSRSGKSNLNLIALDQLLDQAIPFNIIIIDLKKEYRCLLPKHPNLKIITFKNLRLNPLEVPEWEDPKDHINNVAEVFCRENFILAFGKNMFINKTEYLYNEWGVFEGKKKYPTFKDLYNQVNTIKSFGREAQSKATLLSRLKPYIDYPDIFCCKSFPFNTWLDNHLVIELENITNEMYATVANLITSSIYSYYHKKNLRGSETRTLFVVDEAGVLFNAKRDRPNDFGDSYINTLVRRGGEFGLGFWVTSQEPNTISQSIHSNSFLKFMFPLVEGQQIRNMALSMSLDEQQLLYPFKILSEGICIVRYSFYSNPFLLLAPLFSGDKAVSDEFVEEKMRDFYRAMALKQEPDKVEIKKEPQIDQKAPQDAVTLLKQIAEHPFDKYTDRGSKCGLDEHKVKKARDWLKNNGYISLEYIRTKTGRGRSTCYLVLQKKALNYLNIKQHLGKGSFKHQLYCHLIKEKLQKEGWTAKIETKVYPSSKLIDVVAEKGNDIVGYEVTLHFNNLQKNIKDDFEVIDKLIIVVEKNDFGKATDEIQKYEPSLAPEKCLEVKPIEDFF